MACELDVDRRSATEMFSRVEVDRQRPPVSHPTVHDDADILARLAVRLSLESGSNTNRPQGRWSLHPEAGRGHECEQTAPPHYVSKAPAFVMEGGCSAPSEEGQQAEYVEDQNEEEGDGKDDEGESRPSRTRDKNRRAQQRFRQRQKAKLQAKEQETLQLQKQVQDLQAQLLQIQIAGAGPVYRQQIDQVEARCKALQLENSEIRALAIRLMDENKHLLMERTKQLLPALDFDHQAASAAIDVTNVGTPMAAQQHVQQTIGLPSPMRPQFEWLNAVSRLQLSTGAIPRSHVFPDLHRMPWQVAPFTPEDGLPSGCYPGGWCGARVLLKLLHRGSDGSTTALVKFPPGFEHDYVISTDAQTEEGLILQGSMTDTVLKRTFASGDYFHICPGQQHGPYRADADLGSLCFVVVTRRRSLLA